MSAKSIMIQGTMSNAGKSFVAAAFCRIFYQDGYRCAPFKSQNMALNSYITQDGLEMGRAQVMQAEAAKIAPRVEMNPILLKPTSSMGSQVIVNGEVWQNMGAMEYYRRKRELVPEVERAYRKLEEEFDILVLEGAGSPAEINLKDQDLVNMGMAKMAKAPVLLVADIDRGGVFASIYGTIQLLEKEERAYVKGILINKFRGDVKILMPGLQKIEELTGVPVLGVIPMEPLDLDDEDSLSDRLSRTDAAVGQADVAVIRLPRISNFTDFASLDRQEGVRVRYVSRAEQLGTPDFIILPGTKNTMGDLKWLRQNGLEAAVKRQNAMGVPVLGICGGFQMLGEVLKDPLGTEEKGSLRGMELLPVKTEFSPEKTRTRITGTMISCPEFFRGKRKQEVSGYEIHMGSSTLSEGGKPFLRLSDGRLDGCVRKDGLAAGTYLHGLFDQEDTVSALAGYLREKKGLADFGASVDAEEWKEREYDRLADLVRRSVDMEKIYEILNRGI